MPVCVLHFVRLCLCILCVFALCLCILCCVCCACVYVYVYVWYCGIFCVWVCFSYVSSLFQACFQVFNSLNIFNSCQAFFDFSKFCFSPFNIFQLVAVCVDSLYAFVAMLDDVYMLCCIGLCWEYVIVTRQGPKIKVFEKNSIFMKSVQNCPFDFSRPPIDVFFYGESHGIHQQIDSSHQ